MIGPFAEYAPIGNITIDSTTAGERFDGQHVLDNQAQARCAERGLVIQPENLVGQSLVIPAHYGGQHTIQRQRFYCAVPLGEMMNDAVEAMIDAIADRHGPGRVWFLGRPVHLVENDDLPVIRELETSEGPKRCTILRTLYGHHPSPAAWELLQLRSATLGLPAMLRDKAFVPPPVFSQHVQEIEREWMRLGELLDELRKEDAQCRS